MGSNRQRGTGRRAQTPFRGNSGGFRDTEKIGENGVVEMEARAYSGDVLADGDSRTRLEMNRPGGDFSSGMIDSLATVGEKTVESEIRDSVFF